MPAPGGDAGAARRSRPQGLPEDADPKGLPEDADLKGLRENADPLGLRVDAPVLDAYLSFLDAGAQPFTIPGHKQRTGLVGSVVAGDVPLFGGVDTVGLSAGVLAEGECRAARLWGADVCRFSVGGSTHGNQALALAVASPGDQVVVSRTLHRSMLLGLVLAGLEPVWVRPAIDAATGLPAGVPADAVRDALRDNPGARAVLVGDPSYVGGCGDVRGLARAAHDHGVPLVVDAAWGAHLGFHPDLPPHALAAGADALVTSAHKTLPAYSQGALVLASYDRIDRDRLDRAFEATNTTSPAGAILASIDAARALLASRGPELLGETIRLVDGARSRLSQVPGMRVLAGPWVDPTRLVLLLEGTGVHGRELEKALQRRGMPVEMADRDVVVPVVTVADDTGSVGGLVEAVVAAMADLPRGPARQVVPSVAWSVEPETVVSPREAFFSAHTTVSVEAAVGRVCAELVAPYPPGVPVLAPGERVTADAVLALQEARADGARIAYAADPFLATLQVIAS